VPSNGTVVRIFTHPENDLDGEFYVHVRYDMDLMINSISGIHTTSYLKYFLRITLSLGNSAHHTSVVFIKIEG
jgi:hypothetical protein